MAIFSVPNIRFRAVSAVVPPKVESNWDLVNYSDQEKKSIISTTGIEKRRIAESGITAADLCIQSAEKILQELKIDRSEIDILVFVSQTPDHLIPGSSMFIQQKLGLSNSCIALDINQGCAGYVYGLSVIASMMHSAKLRKGLLLVGDTITKTISPDDRSLVPIFSDAGSCTLLEFTSLTRPMSFNLQTDGSGFDKIIINGGGSRVPTDVGNSYLQMNGQDIFDFGLKEVAANIQTLCTKINSNPKGIDYFVMHQANMLLNETIRKKLEILPERTLYSLKDYGNTSCASIPVTLAANAMELNKNAHAAMLLSGFGVGLSWGSVLIGFEFLKCFEIDEYRK